MQIFEKYAVNKSQGIVQIIDGRVRIPVGGWRGLTRIEVQHADVVDALRREWIELVDEQPKSPEEPPRKPIKLFNADGEVKPKEMSPDELDKVLKPAVEEPKVEEVKAEEVKSAPKKQRIPKA